MAVGLRLRCPHPRLRLRLRLWLRLRLRLFLRRRLVRRLRWRLLLHCTQHGAGCGVKFVKESGAAGSLEPGAMEQRALRTPSPLLLCRESAVVGVWPWLWAAHPREAMEERGAVAGLLIGYNSYLTFY